MTEHAGAPQGLTEREEEIYRLAVVSRLTQAAIGERLGISQQRVGQILAEARAKLPAPDLVAIRQEALELHYDVIRRAYELVEREGAPVTAGKDGDVVRDPEDDSVVRDYAGRINALRLALAANAEIRKLLGVDAATRQEVSGAIRYEISGVDLSVLR